MNIAYPFHVDSRGRTGEASRDQHIRQMIEQVLFTMPGERVNRPDFGSGVMQLVFAPASDEMATAAEFLVRGNLQQWLGDLIHIEDVAVTVVDSTLQVSVAYMDRKQQRQQVAQFERAI